MFYLVLPARFEYIEVADEIRAAIRHWIGYRVTNTRLSSEMYNSANPVFRHDSQQCAHVHDINVLETEAWVIPQNR